jgi:hypothetical protein
MSNTTEKSHLLCPLCQGNLHSVDEEGLLVLDGNYVYQCENHADHRFWENSADIHQILHLNKTASQTSFDFEKRFKNTGRYWREIVHDPSEKQKTVGELYPNIEFPKPKRIFPTTVPFNSIP